MTEDVKRAFANEPISHRTDAFGKLLRETTQLLCDQFRVKKTYLLTGSGTLANEAMLWQIKLLGTKGLICSNGEFGNRLILQAQRMQISHETYELPWGAGMKVGEVKNIIKAKDLKWILFCHCETSAGIINPLEEMVAVANGSVLVFADCMSTAGTRFIDLSKVAVATCSSGKGLGSYAGLGIVLSNLFPLAISDMPVYADLHQYEKNAGIPFTISSNMVHALQLSTKQKFTAEQFALIAEYSKKLRHQLKTSGLLVFDEGPSHVLTFKLPHSGFVDELLVAGLTISSESTYLKNGNWGQLALFGYYTREQLDHTVNILENSLASCGLLTAVE